MSLSLFMVLALAAPPSPIPDTRTDIVVVGQRLADIRAAFEACGKRHCTPEEDAAAALAWSQAQFNNGDYADARTTLRTAIGRTERAAKEHPLPVAALFRARTRVDAHLGEYEDMRGGMIRQLRILRTGLSANDPNTIAALVQLGDTNFHVGFAREAETQYRDALSRAMAVGNRQVEAAVRFRLASLYTHGGVGTVTSTEQREVAEVLAPIIAAQDDTLRQYSTAAQIFEARLAERGGATGKVDTLLRTLPPATLPTGPQLLSFKPVAFTGLRSDTCSKDVLAEGNVACQDPRNLASSVDLDKQWIDVAFWITPEGGVRDVEIVRRGASNIDDWPDKVIASIGTRRYAPSKPEDGGPGFYRLERYSLTAPYITITGTKLRQHSVQTTLEVADITPR